MEAAALNELRKTSTRHERELGIAQTRVDGLAQDVAALDQDNRAFRAEVLNEVTTFKKEVNERFDRGINLLKWFIGLSVPAVCTLLGMLIGKS